MRRGQGRQSSSPSTALRARGYRTACFGKWHLGLGAEGRTDYARPLRPGPLELGFDRFFGIPASLDMPPYIYIENDRCVGSPTATKSFKKPARPGPAAPDFEAENVLPDLAKKAVDYIEARAKEDKPFFLYMPLNSPHTPIVPTAEFQGKSGLNEYGDFVCATDWAVGQVMAALERTGAAADTLVLFTSDNGCSPMADFPALLKKNHDPSAGFRGHKADIFEGGHRVPFLARWPGKIAAGSRSGATVCLTDLFATAAEIVGQAPPATAAEDSASLVPAFRGEAPPAGAREAVVHHSINGSFAIRKGKWKLCLCPGSGGWSAPRPGKATKDLPPIQLFDLDADPAEKNNLHADKPEVVAELRALLDRYVKDGRSTPGEPQKNDVAVTVAK